MMGIWELLEFAPKNGERILLLSECGIVVIGSWSDSSPFCGEMGWHTDKCGPDNNNENVEPIRWMKLPSTQVYREFEIKWLEMTTLEKYEVKA